MTQELYCPPQLAVMTEKSTWDSYIYTESKTVRIKTNETNLSYLTE